MSRLTKPFRGLMILVLRRRARRWLLARTPRRITWSWEQSTPPPTRLQVVLSTLLNCSIRRWQRLCTTGTRMSQSLRRMLLILTHLWRMKQGGCSVKSQILRRSEEWERAAGYLVTRLAALWLAVRLQVFSLAIRLGI